MNFPNIKRVNSYHNHIKNILFLSLCTIIYMDHWEIITLHKHNGLSLSLMIDHTRLCWGYLLKEKNLRLREFKNFHEMIQNQFGKKKCYKLIIGNNIIHLSLVHTFQQMVLFTIVLVSKHPNKMKWQKERIYTFLSSPITDVHKSCPKRVLRWGHINCFLSHK